MACGLNYIGGDRGRSIDSHSAQNDTTTTPPPWPPHPPRPFNAPRASGPCGSASGRRPRLVCCCHCRCRCCYYFGRRRCSASTALAPMAMTREAAVSAPPRPPAPRATPTGSPLHLRPESLSPAQRRDGLATADTAAAAAAASTTSTQRARRVRCTRVRRASPPPAAPAAACSRGCCCSC